MSCLAEADSVSARATMRVIEAELRRRGVSMVEFSEWCADRLGGTKGVHGRTLRRIAYESVRTSYATADRYLTVLGLGLWEVELEEADMAAAA
jgi:hypothetical protein